MNLRYIGDSYDIVKRALLEWLSEFGPWQAHPMFTSEVSPEEASAFARLIGVPLLSHEVLTTRTNRKEYFSACAAAGNLFLDPDTGVSLRTAPASPGHISGQELVHLTRQRPTCLTLTFDQSFARGAMQDDIERKLAFLADEGLVGCYYRSHASFLLVSPDRSIVENARAHLIGVVGLPPDRLVAQARPNQRLHRTRTAAFAPRKRYTFPRRGSRR